MSELILWQKEEFDKMRRDLEQLFKRFRNNFGITRSSLEATEPFQIEFVDTENELTFKAKVPGLDPNTIRITVTEETLTIQGESREDNVEKGENYHRIESRSQLISRSISLSCRVRMDEVRATYCEGILNIVLPKYKPRQARRVEITAD